MSLSPRLGTEAASLNASPWSLPPPWLRAWQRDWLAGDVTAGLVVAVMLVPQSLAYAMLAGLPPHVGLMASLLPLLAYAVFGSSAVLSVGPAAITSLMMAQALAPLAVPGTSAYVGLAALLALGSGLLLMAMGWLRLGFLSQLLSRPVVQGFTVASALLIMAGQVAPLLGWTRFGDNVPEMARAIGAHVQWQAGLPMVSVTPGDALVGGASLILLWLGPRVLAAAGRRWQWPAAPTQVLIRLWPLCVLLGATALAQWLAWHTPWRAAQVGAVRLSLDGLQQTLTALAQVDGGALTGLLMPVLLISLVSFVSSMSVSQTFALKHGDRLDADRELLGLGLANLGSMAVGGMAVAGGLSRTVVNEAAGARSPLAGVITTGVLALMLWAFMPWLAWLPRAALGAVVFMAVAGLVQFRGLRDAWHYDRAEAWAFVCTALGVMVIGFDAGILLGIAWSLGTLIWRHSQPHMAEVGRLPGTEHFRNVARYPVECLPWVLMVRVDESLDFTNILRVEQRLTEHIQQRQDVRDVVLLLSAVNHIDHSAMASLSELDDALREQGRVLHLAEVKGPVMDRIRRGSLDKRFAGRIFLSAQHAWDALAPRS
ncbi:MAG TPA: SulP family inorganic anion transporter [Aquabacterium sp.]|nr:SulP family inorganic anion transporter [Aquabacterium sp.]